MDTRGKATAARSYQAVETVGAIHRPKVCRWQEGGKSQCVQRWSVVAASHPVRSRHPANQGGESGWHLAPGQVNRRSD
jgi:hypothetical protein